MAKPVAESLMWPVNPAWSLLAAGLFMDETIALLAFSTCRISMFSLVIWIKLNVAFLPFFFTHGLRVTNSR